MSYSVKKFFLWQVVNLFIILCEHGYVQLSCPMVESESPRFLHYALMCYWKTAPSVIFYDNGFVKVLRPLDMLHGDQKQMQHKEPLSIA